MSFLQLMFDPEDFHARTGLRLTDAHSLDASAITPDVYAAWRAPKCGAANPERMNNPLWEWLVRTGIDAYTATETFGGPSPFDAGPGWCFERMGQSCTVLPDGRRVLIAGEHEDHYDPDFHIYNDVVVWHPDGSLDIFGYPRAVFPPTDSHSATLVGDAIVVIGSLGYRQDRQPGRTRVARLSLTDWSINLPTTTGEGPGHIHKHSANWDAAANAIVLRSGLVEHGDGQPFVENVDDWQLDLKSWHWSRLTNRQWPQFEVRCAERSSVSLFSIRHSLEMASIASINLKALAEAGLTDEAVQVSEWQREAAAERKQYLERGITLELLDALHQPPVPHTRVPRDDFDEDSWNVTLIKVGDAVVRYVDEMRHVRIVIEGALPSHTVTTLVEDFRAKLERIEGTPCLASRLA